MKKLLAVLGTLLLVVGLLTPALAYEITVYDGKSDAGFYHGAQEYAETEPGTQTGPLWDIGGLFIQNNTKTLYVVTGFDPQVGPNNSAEFRMGDLFIKTTGVPAPLDTLGSGINATVANSAFGIYDYVVGTGTSSESAALGGSAYRLVGADTVLTAQGTAVDRSNPWVVASFTSNPVAAAVNFSNGSLTEDDVANGIGTELMRQAGYQWISYNLGFLGNDFGKAYVHVTMRCGNDDGDGKVPVPPSVLLLGSGLLGVGLLRFRRKNAA